MSKQDTYTVQEAKERLGVADKTIRRLLDRKELKEHSRQDNRILITAESVERVAAQLRRPPRSPQEPEQPGATIIQANQQQQLQRVVETLSEVIQTQNDRIFELQRRIAELEAEQHNSPRLAEMEAMLSKLMAERDMTQQAMPVPPPSPSLRPGPSDQDSIQRSLMRKLLKRLGLG